LFVASKYGRYDAIKFLLSSGADCTLWDVDDQSPSIAASSSGYYYIVRLLIAQGALREEYDSNA
jgi:ankyrin repeat protein